LEFWSFIRHWSGTGMREVMEEQQPQLHRVGIDDWCSEKSRKVKHLFGKPYNCLLCITYCPSQGTQFCSPSSERLRYLSVPCFLRKSTTMTHLRPPAIHTLIFCLSEILVFLKCWWLFLQKWIPNHGVPFTNYFEQWFLSFPCWWYILWSCSHPFWVEPLHIGFKELFTDTSASCRIDISPPGMMAWPTDMSPICFCY
jgi:hypothetical protein